MLKSIFFYRNNPLHFHIVVNRMSEKVLRTLFDTWALPQGLYINSQLNNKISCLWSQNAYFAVLDKAACQIRVE